MEWPEICFTSDLIRGALPVLPVTFGWSGLIREAPPVLPVTFGWSGLRRGALLYMNHCFSLSSKVTTYMYLLVHHPVRSEILNY